jgi:ABC-type Fe3+-hydroxamate transport system substrate-binding protein
MLLTSTSRLSHSAKRIISLVPSQTELLHWLGLEKETIAITKFCVHPKEWFKTKIRVGGTKSIDIQKIVELNPDLIIANKEENTLEEINVLAKQFNVLVTDVKTLPDALFMINNIGSITNRLSGSNKLISEINISFKGLLPSPTLIPVAYLIWQKPYMTIGSDTFIHEMMETAGFKNVFRRQLRYPEISIEDIKNSGCRVLMLSSEPFPFKQKHIDRLQQQLPGVLVKLVDGELFSWYGSRLLLAPAYFIKLKKEIMHELNS